jgi:hypothetical protein
VYPDYWGRYPIGGACSAPISTFLPFQLTAHPDISFVGDDEDPTGVSYHTWVSSNAPSGSSPGAVTASSVYGNNAGTIASYPSQNTGYPNGNKDLIAQNTYPVAATKSGDQYCASITLEYTSAYVGPGNVVTAKSGSFGPPNCINVTNKPYYKVYGSGVSAGGNFGPVSGGSCTGGGELGGWFTNQYYDGTTNGYSFGAGSQLSALALLKITGFASAQTVASRSPTDLTFANNDPTAISKTSYSPDLGGKFGSAAGNCLTSEQPPAGASVASGPYEVTGRTVTGSESVFVNGDAYISGNIIYGSWTTKDNVPSFELHATGNIYIDPNVTVLDGVYTAEPTSGSKAIYTCAGPSHYAPMAQGSLYGGCNKQLTIHGSFVAQHVNLMRTYGSLRDEKPNVTSAAVQVPGTGGVPFRRYSCPDTSWAWNHWYQVESVVRKPATAQRPTCSSGWIDEGVIGYVLPTQSNGSAPLYYKASGNTSSSDFVYSTTPLGVGSRIIGYVQTSANGSSFPLLKVCYRTFSSGSTTIHFYTSSCGEGGANTTAFYIYKNAGDGYDTTGTTVVMPPNLVTRAANCSNSNNGANRSFTRVNTCAAEVFDFSPELYLGKPAVKLQNNGSYIWQAITSLPPIL